MPVKLTFQQVVTENGKRLNSLARSTTFRQLTDRSKGLLKWLTMLEKGSPWIATFIEEGPGKDSRGASRATLGDVIREAAVKRALAASHDIWQYPSKLYGVGQPKPERVKAAREAMLNDPAILKQWELVRRATDRDYAKAQYELNIPRR